MKTVILCLLFIQIVNSLENITNKTNEQVLLLQDSGRVVDNLNHGFERYTKMENNADESNKSEILNSAASNYVYRPLFVYRRIEHSKRRITMYNAFAG